MNAPVLCGCLTGGAVLHVLMLCELAVFTCVLCTVHAADFPSHKEEEFVLLHVCYRPEWLGRLISIDSLR